MPRLLLFCAIVALISTPSSAAEDETLWTGLGAYRAGSYDTAVSLLGHATDNPYLETVRLCYRADCLLRDSLYADAAAALETLFALVDSGAVVQNHRFLDRARDLYIEALALGGTCVMEPNKLYPSNSMGGPSSRAWLIASGACLAAGDTSNAMKYFVKGATGAIAPEDSPLFEELFHRSGAGLHACSYRGLMDVASRAADIGLFPEAKAAADLLLAKYPGDPFALLGRANVMFKSGEPERALHECWRVFDSDAPVYAKKTALSQISSIEYGLKRYDKAAKHYYMHGTYYRVPSSLDMAARIYVMQGDWKKALAAWATLRERHRGNGIYADVMVWIEAGLSEAALRFWLGENAEAHAILRDVLPRARGAQCASVLYWLMKTSSTDSERTAWSDSLLHAWPRSFYASAARGDERPLEIRASDLDTRDIDALARRGEDRLARCDTASVDSAFALHPAVRAYVDLLDHGFNDEAEATVRALIGIRDLVLNTKPPPGAGRAVPGRLFKLYAEASTHGLDALSLTLLSNVSPTDSSDEFPGDLWYPLSYVDEVRAGAASAGISPLLVLAIIREESRFDPNVVSRAGAIGLMQLMPATASWHSGLADSIPLGGNDLRDPAKNIRAGTGYFRYLLERFDGSVVGALAAYNGGEGRMARWKESFDPRRNPLVALELIGPRETRRYVKKVLDARSSYAAFAAGRGPGE
jgi:soluble lytic murein transglycosylase